MKIGLTEMIKDYAQSGKPLLGICLGMQLLFEDSDENGFTEGLELLPGSVRRFPGKTKGRGRPIRSRIWAGTSCNL